MAAALKLNETDPANAYLRDKCVRATYEVNYTSSIFVNGKLCGPHVGGYVPFSVDITDALKPDGEENLPCRLKKT